MTIGDYPVAAILVATVISYLYGAVSAAPLMFAVLPCREPSFTCTQILSIFRYIMLYFVDVLINPNLEIGETSMI